jgi:hypothetical protein
MEQAEHAIIFYFLARILRLSPLSAPVCPPIYPPYAEKEPAEAGSFSLPQKPRRVRGAHAANQIKSVFSGGVDF